MFTEPAPPAIESAGLGVKFDLRLSRHRTLIRTVADLLTRSNGDATGAFWALRDVSFTVRAGDVLGVIGRNGSGKSTLLLSIAGTLKPDSGRVDTFGSTPILLTLGAGFEPNLTGYENIYLNGAFFGLSRKAIENRIAQIVEFSELGDFIYVPLRKYSSGMRARLGFSIAVHTEPEILLLDEVLGVGDASFKRKSRDKLRELMKSARAIVIVTHDMTFITDVCAQAIWLEEGAIACSGNPHDVVAAYLAKAERPSRPLRTVPRVDPMGD